MLRHLPLVVCLFAALPAAADGWIAARTIRAGTTVLPGDIIPDPARAEPGPKPDIIGLEARVTVFGGMPLLPQDFGPRTRVERNQIVPLAYARGPLVILTEGRALERGGEGDRIRAMNLASRITIVATVMPDGTLRAGPETSEETP